MLGPFATTSRLTPIHQMSLVVLLRTASASMSTTTTTTTTTTRDRGDRYGPMEWTQLANIAMVATANVANEHGSFNRITHVAPICTSIVVTWAHKDQHPKWHLSRICHYCRARRTSISNFLF